jgi:membrane associated rhomboid family serine protease
MGVADRDYMRDEYYPSRVTMKLIVVLIVAFVVESAIIFYGHLDIMGELGLTGAGLMSGKVWQLFTFQFLHLAPWPWHVLLNCVALYFLGRPVEEVLGAKKFLIVYLLAGVFGGLVQVASTMLLPGHVDVPVVGASAGICGIVAIYCTLYPMRELTTWAYFMPITLRAWYLLVFLAALSLFGTFIPFDGVAHGAHLGGLTLGWFYAKKFVSGDPLFGTRDEVIVSSLPPEKKSPAKARSEIAEGEIDAILDKINAKGINSLTTRERELLEAARKKMAQR